MLAPFMTVVQRRFCFPNRTHLSGDEPATLLLPAVRPAQLDY